MVSITAQETDNPDIVNEFSQPLQENTDTQKLVITVIQIHQSNNISFGRNLRLANQNLIISQIVCRST
jgi:hypothetical protein